MCVSVCVCYVFIIHQVVAATHTSPPSPTRRLPATPHVTDIKIPEVLVKEWFQYQKHLTCLTEHRPAQFYEAIIRKSEVKANQTLSHFLSAV